MRKALVIEDVPELASFVIAAFEYLKFEAYAVDNVVDAIDILKADPHFAAVYISTCQESRVSAFGIATLIAAHWPAMKIFISSERLDRLSELPPCFFLAKPLNSRSLIPMIEQAFRIRSKRRS